MEGEDLIIGKNVCIFCGRKGRLSGEHLYADYLKQYLPRPGKRTTHRTTFLGGSPQVGTMDRPGDMHTRRLRVVCSSCNNGWLNDLEQAARKILVPLINDDWSALTVENQRTLATWATGRTMVWEFNQPETVAIPQTERTFLMERRVPLPNWLIWIGRFDSQGLHPANHNHFAFKHLAIHKENGLQHEGLIQTTGITVGKLLVQTWSAPKESWTPPFYQSPDDVAVQFGVRTIIPDPNVVVLKPEQVHTLDGYYALSNSWARRMGLQNFRL